MKKMTLHITMLFIFTPLLIYRVVVLPIAPAEENDFDRGECTWWVAEQWTKRGWPLPIKEQDKPRHAKKWYTTAPNYGLQIGKEPRPGAIAIFHNPNSSSPLLREYGHVAFVESVGGNSWTISEYNWAGKKEYGTRNFNTWSPPSLIGFIYPPVTYSEETILIREKIKFYKEKIQSISTRLISAIPHPPFIVFNLVSSEEVNAWTDGRVTTGLMESLYGNATERSNDQLAMALAHIIAHRKLETETVSRILESGLGVERKNLDKNVAIFDLALSVIKTFAPLSPIAEITNLGSEKAGKAFFDWHAKRTLKTLQENQENAAHFFGMLYVDNAGFDAKEGLQIFERPTEFGKQHPINLNFWQNYARETQARLEQEGLPKRTLENRKELMWVPERMEGNRRVEGHYEETVPDSYWQERKEEAKVPINRTLEDGFIKLTNSYKIYLLFNGKRYPIPDRATLESLNFEKFGVRELSSSAFYSIPGGSAEEAKEVFDLWKAKEQERRQPQLPEVVKKGEKSPIAKLSKSAGTFRKERIWVPEHVEGKRRIEGHYEEVIKEREEPPTTEPFKIPEVYKKDRKAVSKEVPSPITHPNYPHHLLKSGAVIGEYPLFDALEPYSYYRRLEEVQDPRLRELANKSLLTQKKLLEAVRSDDDFARKYNDYIRAWTDWFDLSSKLELERTDQALRQLRSGYIPR